MRSSAILWLQHLPSKCQKQSHHQIRWLTPRVHWAPSSNEAVLGLPQSGAPSTSNHNNSDPASETTNVLHNDIQLALPQTHQQMLVDAHSSSESNQVHMVSLLKDLIRKTSAPPVPAGNWYAGDTRAVADNSMHIWQCPRSESRKRNAEELSSGISAPSRDKWKIFEGFSTPAKPWFTSFGEKLNSERSDTQPCPHSNQQVQAYLCIK